MTACFFLLSLLYWPLSPFLSVRSYLPTPPSPLFTLQPECIHICNWDGLGGRQWSGVGLHLKKHPARSAPPAPGDATRIPPGPCRRFWLTNAPHANSLLIQSGPMG